MGSGGGDGRLAPTASHPTSGPWVTRRTHDTEVGSSICTSSHDNSGHRKPVIGTESYDPFCSPAGTTRCPLGVIGLRVGNANRPRSGSNFLSCCRSHRSRSSLRQCQSRRCRKLRRRSSGKCLKSRSWTRTLRAWQWRSLPHAPLWKRSLKCAASR